MPVVTVVKPFEPVIFKDSPNFLTALPLLPLNVICKLRTSLIALTTSPAVTTLFELSVVATLPCPSVVIFVVFTSNFTMVSFGVLVTFAVVKFPSLKFTTPLLLIRERGVSFSCMLKPLLFNTA